MTKYLVKHRPSLQLTNAALSIVVVVAWLLASNHCVLAGFLPQATETMTSAGVALPTPR